jgi:hypothetical protein
VAEKESNVFFVNDNGRLNNVSRESGLDFPGNSRSAAYLDFDRDGDLDIIVNNYHDRARFFRNNTDQRRDDAWFSVQLRGDPAQQVSRDAIGTRVIATTPAGNRVWRELHGSIGYLSAHPQEQHFGLGKEHTAELRVEWPNGKVSTFEQIAANHRYLIDQAENTIRTLALVP